MPKPIVDKLNAAFRQAINTPEIKQRLEAGGYEITGTTSADEFTQSIKADTEVFRKIVVSAGIKPE
jgi:hypothetical protein